LEDPSLQKTRELLGTKNAKEFVMGSNGVLRFRDRVCVIDDAWLKRLLILEEGYKSYFSMHPSMTKRWAIKEDDPVIIRPTENMCSR